MRMPKSLRPHIGIFGRRNTGKSSLMNFLTGFSMALVSPVAGTTTDPVEKSVELFPLGPVVFVDTAGIDDDGPLGELRIKKSFERLAKVDVALLVSDGEWGAHEDELLSRLSREHIPVIVVWSKADVAELRSEVSRRLEENGTPAVSVSALQETGLAELMQAMIQAMPLEALAVPSMLSDIVPQGGICLFVTPIDSSAPKGRLIAPQVQALRDCLDSHSISMVVQPQELPGALAALNTSPDLLVCDTQAVDACAAAVPPELPLTTYSILMARLKGDLPTLSAGAAAINALRDGDKVCVCEACAHHVQPDDIGRVKIPRLLARYTGADLDISFRAGREYPESLRGVDLIIHCGGCMMNRPAMLARMGQARRQGVPITNYGVAISLMQNVLERSLQLFPEALAAYRAANEHHWRAAAQSRR